MYYNSETKFFEGTLLITNTFELGTFDLYRLSIYDTAGNITGLHDDNYEELENGNFTFFKEENPPTFSMLSLEQNSVKPGEIVRINLEATDDTKLQEATIHYIAPISKNKNSIELSFDNNTSSFNGEFSISGSSEEGIWKVDSIEIKDTNLNTTIIKGVDFDLSSGEFTVEDVTAPSSPSVDEVTDKSTNVTGTAEADSSIIITVGSTVIGTGKTTTHGAYSITIKQQKAGSKLLVTAKDAAGNSSIVKEVSVKDVTAPIISTINEVTDKSTSVTGIAEAGSTITVKEGTTVIGNAITDTEEKYVATILKQKAGTKLTVIATDYVGNISEPKEVTVIDITAPAAPTVDEVTDNSTSVTGTAEVGSLITIKSGTIEKGSDTVNSEGGYSVLIELQKAGTILTITATDAAKNSSDPVEVTVTDATTPLIPTVNEVTDKSTSVSGTAEVGSLIKIKSGTTEIGLGTVDSEGNYTVEIAQQKAGTQLLVTATDTAGNTSEIREVTVVDVTAPTMPTVNEVTDKSTSVTGSAEAGSSIIIKVGTTIVGTGTTPTDGKFSVVIPNQKADEILMVIATDLVGNVSAETKITVVKSLEETNRIAGEDRYETAVSISQEGWNSSETVVLATGTNFPDALAGGPLAYKENAPILLTRPTRLVEVTELEIKRLNAKKVIILGSEGAVSLDVEIKLKQMGLVVERIGGENRFETAALIAKRLPSEQAIIAYGFNFPDVLSISPYAAKNGIPILLTRSDRVPAETLNAMVGKNNTILVGSTSVISEHVAQQFPQPVRYGGATRFDTGKEIISKLPMGTGKAYVATGRNFPDALAGSVLAAKNNAPILLVNETTIPTPTKDLILNYDSFSIFGSRGAVGDEVQSELNLALER
ncbi:Ig-like domain-containing protein [Paenisporosarcina sp. TG20]|uniref:Ig-like domain-containing protein n=1 Tax=Paenisporosarcina sp. TG20 TaxID=1211706 RepID=UPI0003814551|nr:Ig-like domain-containing protein [Paenisporosarcina sp. TG20]